MVRELPKSLGVAAFFDYGNAFDKLGRRRKLAYSVGVGLRVRLPVLTLGIDIAQAAVRAVPAADRSATSCTPGSPRLHINFSPKL